MRSVIQLARENQVHEQRLKVIGVSPDGKASLFNTFSELEDFVTQAGKELDIKYTRCHSKNKITSDGRTLCLLDGRTFGLF